MQQYHRASIITSDQAIARFRNDPDAEQTGSETIHPSYAGWSIAALDVR
jgi:hypothetical protein